MGATVSIHQGKLEGDDQGGLSVFKGIPFAAPPVGARRWLAPEKPASWTRSARRSSLRRGRSSEQVDAQRALRVRDRRRTIRGLPHAQRLDSRARRQAPARDGLDSRRRLYDRIGLAVALRRLRARAARRHRRRHHQLSPRAAGLPAPGRRDQRQDSVNRQRRNARSSRGAANGSATISPSSAATPATSPSSANRPAA